MTGLPARIAKPPDLIFFVEKSPNQMQFGLVCLTVPTKYGLMRSSVAVGTCISSGRAGLGLGASNPPNRVRPAEIAADIAIITQSIGISDHALKGVFSRYKRIPAVVLFVVVGTRRKGISARTFYEIDRLAGE